MSQNELRELRSFVADDAAAISYQSLGQYRSALLRLIDESIARRLAGEGPKLWALHVQGPDDLHAAPSREHAQMAADRMNAWWAERSESDDPLLCAAVIEWPHDAASHAASVDRFIADWLIPRAHLDAIQPATTENGK